MSRLAALVVLVLFACPYPALACPLHLCKTALGVWHAYVDEHEHNEFAGQPYWDGNSWDTDSFADDPNFQVNPGNVGALLEGHTATLRNGTQVNLGPDAPGLATQFLTRSNDPMDPDFFSTPGAFSYEHNEGPARYTFKFLTEITSNFNTTEFGWFPDADPMALNPIFVGADGPGDVWKGTLPGSVSFYLWEHRQNVIYRTTTEPEQFAPFLLNDVHYIGIEDRAGVIDRISRPGTSDYDYNDVVICLRQEPVAEPALLWLFGMGLTAGGVFIRRTRRTHQ